MALQLCSVLQTCSEITADYSVQVLSFTTNMSEPEEESQSGGLRELLEDLIEAYRNEPCLWQTKMKEYHDRNKKDAAYRRLLEIYKSIDAKATRDIVVKKINNMRTSYKKELNKIKASEKSGAGSDEIYTPKLWYFKLFTFLNEQETPKTSISNLSDEDGNEVRLKLN
ncbi:hypothetical protein NQ314_008819 [Rhamnusium bicolor]|uniref:MADF domain-containing protein n=1 Tax=Rhamnusium bicolor TaxID=1586634 RepID=A0AAV8Y6U7_9CUCU|nr:hypothetical protein NQ314_008819 [Rhamnusium bicolor]